MCGIAGLARLGGPSFDAEPQARSMADRLRHRGPDDHGSWSSPRGHVALSHRRLSIVDLSPLGRNPMLWDGGRLAITFNGEIYNYLDLRQELEAEGYRFRSHTDTEVILAAYDRWDTECVHRFVGMFAFALWDERRERLWLVRDRFGKKPLYYTVAGGWLRFASELKCLLDDPAVTRQVDPVALHLYLRYGYVPAPHSIFTGISKLEPAHWALCADGQLTLQRYWDPLTFARRPLAMSDGEAEETLESLLAVAVQQRRIADVPIGAFLSGGIDSSLVVALMQEQAANTVRTFAIRFEDRQFNEADHAAAVARHLRTHHYEHPCGAGELLTVVDRIPEMFDEPFGDSSAIPTFVVSAAARRHMTVALSGDGGDELFAGYPRYQHFLHSRRMLDWPASVRHAAAVVLRQFPNRRLRRAADVLSSDESDAYARFIAWMNPAEIDDLLGTSAEEAPLYGRMRRDFDDRVPLEEQPLLLDLVSYLPDDILTKVDRASMSVSLEVRSPLLDHRVAEFAISLPHRFKHRDGENKWLLRRLLFKRVPRALVDRPKMGFGVPLEAWLRGPLRERMEAHCRDRVFDALGINGATVTQRWTKFVAGYPDRPDVLWQLMVLGDWARHYAVA